jgi:hypothetical protein
MRADALLVGADPFFNGRREQLVTLAAHYVIGAIIAGLVLMERRSRHWVVCLRLPEELHRRLREEATDHMCSLKAEIINRLQASFQ